MKYLTEMHFYWILADCMMERFVMKYKTNLEEIE